MPQDLSLDDEDWPAMKRRFLLDLCSRDLWELFTISGFDPSPHRACVLCQVQVGPALQQ